MEYIKDGISLYCNDYKEILKQLPNDYVDLIITDPPYKTTKRGISEKTNTGETSKNTSSSTTSGGKYFQDKGTK